MKANAVFEGGGMRGIGIVGALAYLENQGYEWQHIAGTSVGAVIASLLAAGYTSKEMMNILSTMNFKDFLDKDGFHRLPLLGKAIGFLVDKGLYSGDYFEAWIDKLLKAKGISKFKDVTVDGKCRLKIVASDITRRRTFVLPDDLPQYGIKPMEFSIVRAVRMSISIPFYFKPVQFLHAHGLSYIVDGALCCNFPINIFDSDKIIDIPTIGFKFDCPDISNTRIGKTDPISFLMDIVNTISAEKNREWLREENISRTILIPTGDIAPTDFNISSEKILRLFKSGYKSASKFHTSWDFKEYINKHCQHKITEKEAKELFS
ncbi:patatin-like phospholipase family protein [Clostridium sp. DJ247]|uniref:patatin-like phospholipase family protein n=1 Tax=Clostridium sp. DJ247 TaxID=2726188 RepID=UPI00162A08A1|nr:patatin-like phospholipase family protein [Clostridium sp. DJ247]MBC2580807.1 patatin-like phospholipase family protein [Clostridium sp. DJ247]